VTSLDSFTVTPSNTRNDVFPEDPLNILIHSVRSGDEESDTNFTSYVWFYSDMYEPDYIMCESAEDSASVMFSYPDVTTSPAAPGTEDSTTTTTSASVPSMTDFSTKATGTAEGIEITVGSVAGIVVGLVLVVGLGLVLVTFAAYQCGKATRK
jgi:hypothetical protein